MFAARADALSDDDFCILIHQTVQILLAVSVACTLFISMFLWHVRYSFLCLDVCHVHCLFLCLDSPDRVQILLAS